MAEKAFIRDLEGKMAIYVETIEGEPRKVLLRVDDKRLMITAEEWDSLPLWQGSQPALRS